MPQRAVGLLTYAGDDVAACGQSYRLACAEKDINVWNARILFDSTCASSLLQTEWDE